ncbi:hypothetical protein [Shouchella miscanthi]|uniref:hypothetical protein n=1 Tax=Shouchella miscanthi TaxID=2598861 RepID=UPI0011A5DCF2|nr:hypothetical protein [Shouchella miscanthi]
MKTWLLISTLWAMLLIVGCNTANNQEEPQEGPSTEQPSEEDEGVDNENERLAVEHEFTNNFLVETDVEPGFHQMRGKLDGFEMLIPENGIISDLLHATENNDAETVIYTFNNEPEKKLYDVQVMYQSHYPEGLEQSYLNVFKHANNFEGEYEYTEVNDLEVYYGSYDDEDEYGPYLKYFGYLFSADNNQSISFSFTVMCQGEENCNFNHEEEAEMAEKLMYSIRLLDQ